MKEDQASHDAGRRGVTFRLIQEPDNPALAAIIREVMTEHGACGPGYSIHDPEVNCMFESYTRARAAFFVVARGDAVLGGAGFAPLEGADDDVCELRKMYFQPEARGLGLAAEILTMCLAAARAAGFRTCYLETLQSMDRARKLYRGFGFLPLAKPMGSTGHFSCDSWFALELAPVRSATD